VPAEGLQALLGNIMVELVVGSLPRQGVAVAVNNAVVPQGQWDTTAIQDGDDIEMDVARRSLNLLIDETEMKRRLETWTSPSPRATKGILGLYARYASSHATGAYIL